MRGRQTLAALLLLCLSACDGSPQTEASLLARQQTIDPPQLWRVEVIGDDNAVRSAVYVCADASLHEAFMRARAEVNGKSCKDYTSPLIKPNGWILRCVAEGRAYAVSSTTIGDPERDFRFGFGLTELFHYATPQQPSPLAVRQLRHFLRMGACPPGWRIGDQAKPGRRPSKAGI